MSALKFLERLQTMRLSAAVLYDRGKGLGQSDEELGKAIQPLMKGLVVSTAKAVEEDFCGVVEAIKHMRAEVKMHESDARRIAMKIEDTKNHVKQLEHAIMANMKATGIGTRMHKGYSATLVEVDGKLELTLR